jgi:hypothetical protein
VKVVHFSSTNLAGAPMNIVRALREWTDVDARLVNLHPNPCYGDDLVHSASPEAALEAARAADIIHLHNVTGLDPKEYDPINLDELAGKGVPIVRHFHSSPGFLARKAGIAVDALTRWAGPSLVIGQFQERYYPNAYVVRNPVCVDGPAEHCSRQGETRVLYAVSPGYRDRDAWWDRWNTKGFPETRDLLLGLARRHKNTTVSVLVGVAYSELMRAKADADIVVDELVTGSYHLSGLEGLALGKPTLSYTDNRCEQVLRLVSGSSCNPFLSVPLEDAESILSALIRSPEACRDIGRHSAEWFASHWSPQVIASEFLHVYETLLQDPTSLRRQKELALDTEDERFRSIAVPDCLYHRRREQARHGLGGSFYAAQLWLGSAGGRLRTLLRKVRNRLRRLIRPPKMDS